jgi:ATP-dependent RNA helicase DDX27
LKPVKIGEKQPSLLQKKKRDRAGTKVKAGTKKGSAFDKEMGHRTAREGVRAKKGDVIGGMGKKKGGKPRKAK